MCLSFVVLVMFAAIYNDISLVSICTRFLHDVIYLEATEQLIVFSLPTLCPSYLLCGGECSDTLYVVVL